MGNIREADRRGSLPTTIKDIQRPISNKNSAKEEIDFFPRTTNTKGTTKKLADILPSGILSEPTSSMSEDTASIIDMKEVDIYPDDMKFKKN